MSAADSADPCAAESGAAGSGAAGAGTPGLGARDLGSPGLGTTGFGAPEVGTARIGGPAQDVVAIAKAIRHVAIIMDGNGRWAQSRGLKRIQGHEHGVESVRAVTRHAARLGLGQLTLFAFSTENWKRPRAEVHTLMRLLRRFLIDERPELMENDVRLTSIGRIEGLPKDVQRALRETEALTGRNAGMVLCLALNYGARQELADAARRLAQDAAEGRLRLERMSDEALEAALEERLYQPKMPPLDLLIRTAGEKRLSNFLLWQMSYGEFHSCDVGWPEFREDDLEAALRDYARRTRTFGGLVRP